MSKKVCILVDYQRVSAKAEGVVLSGWDLQFIEEKLKRAGIHPEEVHLETLSRTKGFPTEAEREACLERLSRMPELNLLIALDEVPLQYTTGHKGISKWHLSPLDSLPHFGFRKVIPTFHPDQVKKDFTLGLYVELAFRRAREEKETQQYARKPRRFRLNPSLEETLHILDGLRERPELAVDIETGRGQINTVGFAWSPSDAIAIGVLPDRCGSTQYYALWDAIRRVCEGPSRKIMQNGIYERLYFARYGIHVENFTHDTMVCQKFLWPELEKGLDNVGRIYTREPYWKDTGRVEGEEGKRKDWGAIRDWSKHFLYNALDTSGTFEAYVRQREDLEARGLSGLHDSYLTRFFEPLAEMCLRGLPVCAETQARLISEYETEVARLAQGLSRELNTRSSKQKLQLFRDKGYKIPKVRDKASNSFRESVNELSLKKMRLAHPEDRDIAILLAVAEKEKALSSYLRCETDPLDGNVRFMLDPHGTETGRWSSSKDAWGRGFNGQTIPKYAKKMIRFPNERIFVQIDLKQAESRFVAYDSCDANLIGALEDPKRDIHSEVAAEIFGCSVEQVVAEKKAGDDGKRQLGKKSGHGANYAMKETTFMESCLKELDLVLSKPEATRTLEAYHKLFPGIRRWHRQIRETIYRERRLTSPTGRVRYFYGRMDDNTFREGYAYRPQTTVPDITNNLMLALEARRTEGAFDFHFHNQVHDSIVLSCDKRELDRIAGFCLDPALWHPEVILPAGRLVIPTSVEFGPGLGDLEGYEG